MVKQAVPDSIADSPICRTLEVFQGKWNAWVLYALRTNGEMRFGELRRSIPGISNTMLSATLKALEEQGLVARTQIESIPPVRHVLADKKGRGPSRRLRRHDQMGFGISLRCERSGLMRRPSRIKSPLHGCSGALNPGDRMSTDCAVGLFCRTRRTFLFHPRHQGHHDRAASRRIRK